MDVGAEVGVWVGTANSVGVDGTAEIAWQAAVSAARPNTQSIASVPAKECLEGMMCSLRAITTYSHLSSSQGSFKVPLATLVSLVHNVVGLLPRPLPFHRDHTQRVLVQGVHMLADMVEKTCDTNEDEGH